MRPRCRMGYDMWQWLFFGIAAMIIGMSKCGIPGLGILNVLIFQNFLLAKDATGFGLPLLVVGDLCAVIAFRRHADWPRVFGLIPWAGAGVVLGFATLGYVDNVQARLLIAISLVAMVAMHFLKRDKGSSHPSRAPASKAAPLIGAAAGFVSMIANAAGPLMTLYLLSMRLPKMAFMGTSVYFFTLLNLFKVPFLVYLDIITIDSIGANLLLAPIVIVGAFLGYFFARKVNQVWFDRTAFWLTIAAVVYMVWNAAREVAAAYG